MFRFAVVGNPVSHSKSPTIHSLFASQTGIELEYTRVELQPEEFEPFVRSFFAAGGKGLNVTVPYKESAFRVAESCSPRASLARAVNTLYRSDGRLAGDNTDGIGLVNDLTRNHGITLTGSHILILGAGGAVRGALAGLAGMSVASVTIANRTEARARQLQHDFNGILPLQVITYTTPVAARYDLIINGTSSGLTGDVPPLPPDYITPGCRCYDMLYASADTPFVAWARRHGATAVFDGLGMLVEQAAESFRVWLDIRPDTREVIAALRRSLG